MGLLGNGFDDPQTQFNLALASGLLSSRGGFGQALGQAMPMAMQARQQGQAAIAQRQQEAIKQQLMMAQIEDEKAQAAQRSASARAAQEDLMNQAGLQQYFSSLGTVNLPNGPTNEAAATAKPKEFDINEFLRLPGAMKNMPIAKGYLEARDIGKPSYSSFKDIETPDGPKIVGLTKSGEYKVLPLSPVKKQPLVKVDMGKDENKFKEKLQEGQAKVYGTAQEEALMAKQGNVSLDRIDAILKEGQVTAGPLGGIESTARALASQFGMPVDSAMDKRNARFKAEFVTRLASKILTGGKAITDNDAKVIASSFPGFDDNGISYEQLPAYIAALRRINNERISNYQWLNEQLPGDVKKDLPFSTIDFTGGMKGSSRLTYDKDLGDFK